MFCWFELRQCFFFLVYRDVRLSDVIFQTIISFICTTVGREGEKPCISAPLCQISSFLIRIAALEIISFHLAASSSSNINKTNNPVCFVFIF